MNLREMRRLLEERDIRLTRSLGQNFLHDRNQIDRIVAAAGIERGERVIEIGPGLGPLTQKLWERSPNVLAIEKDRRLVAYLTEAFREHAGIEIVYADALEFIRETAPDWDEFKVVSNLPYSVGTMILVELAQLAGRPRRIVVTLQREVVERVVAGPGNGQYGVLSLLIQLRYTIGGWFRIPAGCFFPEPEVESACVVLDRRQDPLLSFELERVFDAVVKLAFSQRRKMMAKLLKSRWPESRVEAAMERAGLDRRVRAEACAIEQYVDVARELEGNCDGRAV